VRTREVASPPAWSGLFAIAGAAVLALAVTAGRYGYHRDELYFIAAGAHLAWGYPDQPLLAPLMARAADLIAPGSLLVLRAPSIITCAVTTVTTGLFAREAGGGKHAQWLAAAAWAVGAVCLVTGHLVSTTTYDVGVTAVVSLLIARLVRTGDTRLWVPAGAVLGVGLLNKSLVGVVIAVVLLAYALIGPREILRSRWLLVGACLAILGALPYAIWQLAHGLPEQQLAASIASSGAEGGRAGLIPFQLVLISPLLAPVWLCGLVALLRADELRALRPFAVAYLVLIPIFIITGGKAYYMAGLYPALLGVGACVVERWRGRGDGLRRRLRSSALIAALVLSAAASAVIGLGILPERDLQGSIVMKLNPDAGEMVGWPRFTATVAGVYHSLPPATQRHTAIFTSNYGEAGAIAQLGPKLGLPYPYSGHNGWWFWGPPPNSDTSVVLVGFEREQAQAWFVGCALRARINDGIALNNNEQGAPVLVCDGERRPWSELWLSLRHYD